MMTPGTVPAKSWRVRGAREDSTAAISEQSPGPAMTL
jgi:hypothetical protein